MKQHTQRIEYEVSFKARNYPNGSGDVREYSVTFDAEDSAKSFYGRLVSLIDLFEDLNRPAWILGVDLHWRYEQLRIDASQWEPVASASSRPKVKRAS